MAHCPLCGQLIRTDRPIVYAEGKQWHRNCRPKWEAGMRKSHLDRLRKQRRARRRFYADRPVEER